MNIKKRQIIGDDLYVGCMIAEQFILWAVGIAHVSSSFTMFMTNSMLLWWILDSVPLPLVIKQKVAKEAMQWSSERRAQVQSYVNQPELTSELNLKCNYFQSRRHGYALVG